MFFLPGPPGYNKLADYMVMLSRLSRQDSVLFFNTEPNDAWLKYLVRKDPLFFRSNWPMFMPGDYVNMVELNLDTNLSLIHI